MQQNNKTEGTWALEGFVFQSPDCSKRYMQKICLSSFSHHLRGTYLLEQLTPSHMAKWPEPHGWVPGKVQQV